MHNETTIPDEHLEFIERELFHEFDAAYARYQDGYHNHQEVLAYERALETMTKIRELLSDRNDTSIEETAGQVLEIFDELDERA